MSGKTKIEWLNGGSLVGRTWNPVTGCTKISAGCKNCYAERMSKRLAGRCGYPADEPFKVTLHPDRLEEPVRWKKPSLVFVCSMGDLFHEDVESGFINDVIEQIAWFPRQWHWPSHTFIFLTKRPDRMSKIINDFYNAQADAPKSLRDPEPLPNLWLGVTVENQEQADARIRHLLLTPAAQRIISYEPALGPVDFRPYLSQLDWVICGGESGPGARPIHPDWARSLRDQCKATGVPFFFKQWGEWGVIEKRKRHCGAAYKAGEIITTTTVCSSDKKDIGSKSYVAVSAERAYMMSRLGKKRAGRLLDGVEHNAMPEATR